MQAFLRKADCCLLACADWGGDFEVEGLLQHDSLALETSVPDEHNDRPAHERIYRSSRTVVSFFKNPLGSRLSILREKIVAAVDAAKTELAGLQKPAS